MVDEHALKMIRDATAALKKPVRLILFTSDRGCEWCPDARELAAAIKGRSPKIAFETYDMVMDRDKTELYGIEVVPTIVIQDGAGHVVKFWGVAEDIFLQLFMDSIRAASDGKIWFTDVIRGALRHLERDVRIRVFVESDCPQCRPVAETAVGLAFESALISTDVIIASDFPELIKKFSIKKLPKTIFGANLHMDGHVTESEFLEMIFQAEGIKPETGRRCVICGNPSPDIICATCKTRIQAEAVNHKTRMEKGLQQA